MATTKKKHILTLISEFREKVETIKKNAENPFHKNKYATLENVMETIEAPLKEVGLDYIQIPRGDMLETIIFEIDNPDNKISATLNFSGVSDMQKAGSAITYARRYSLVSTLGLEQEDDDGNEASGHQAKVTTQQIIDLANEKGVDLSAICKAYQVSEIKFLKQEQKVLVLSQLKRK